MFAQRLPLEEKPISAAIMKSECGRRKRKLNKKYQITIHRIKNCLNSEQRYMYLENLFSLNSLMTTPVTPALRHGTPNTSYPYQQTSALLCIGTPMASTAMVEASFLHSKTHGKLLHHLVSSRELIHRLRNKWCNKTRNMLNSMLTLKQTEKETIGNDENNYYKTPSAATLEKLPLLDDDDYKLSSNHGFKITGTMANLVWNEKKRRLTYANGEEIEEYDYDGYEYGHSSIKEKGVEMKKEVAVVQKDDHATLSEIYQLIKQFATNKTTGKIVHHICLQDLKHFVLSKGHTVDDLENCILECEDSKIWHISKDGESLMIGRKKTRRRVSKK